MATTRKPPGPEIPDLERDPRPAVSARPSADPRVSGRPSADSQVSSAPAGSPRPGAGPSGSPQDYFGSGNFDSDDFGDDAGSLELELGEAEPSTRSATNRVVALAPSADADSLDLYDGPSTNVASAVQAVSARAAVRTWPAGTSPDTASIRIDAVEIALVADYGTAPASLFRAPAYTLRVLRRKRVLATRVTELAAHFAAAERDRDALIVSMVQDLRGRILMTDEGDTLFSTVVEIERTALDRRSALAGTSAEYDRRAKDLEEHAALLRKEADERLATVGRARASLDERRHLLDRSEAKKKRLFIEVRAIIDAAEKAAASMTPTQSAKLEQLEEEVSRHKPDLELRAREMAAAQATLDSAAAEQQKVERKLRELDRLKKELDQTFQKQIGARSEGVEAANQQRVDAFASIGRAVLAAKGRLVDVPEEILDAITRSEKIVVTRATELEKTLRALDSYDRNASRNGLAVAVAVVGAVLLALILLARH